MILKASQRGGGQDLAVHLMRADENEHVELHEVRGFGADTLKEAFREAYAISKGTCCRQYLFSMSLNPPESEDVPIKAFEDAIARIETKLGLEGQPRAIVFHEKEGRRHAHAVWSRIDPEDMKAKQLSHFKVKLRDISRELYLEHGWKMPRGLMNAAERDPTNFTLAEWQQAKRAGTDPRHLKETVQDCWAVSDSRASFEHALGERGFWLARGDRRGFAVLDFQGEVWSLARLVGVKAKDLRGRLGDESDLRSVEDTKALIAERMTPALKNHIAEARRSFQSRMAVAHKKAEMVGRHRAERAKLAEEHKKRNEREAFERAKLLPKGLKALWLRVTGRYRKIADGLEADIAAAMKRDRSEREAMIARQLAERRKLQAAIKVDRSRQAELLRQLRREASDYIRGLARPDDSERNRRRSRGSYLSL
ncbi:MAG: relaxase/mobilization nuclease domain-containing protein [Alphaproteobacteria bacterium]|nr:relaxase/mobilization nuclease domain-containing protein [Alphaproteobacteria bacterium]